MDNIMQYVTYVKEMFVDTDTKKKFRNFLLKYNIEGTEVYMNDVHTRTEKLYTNIEEKDRLVNELSDIFVKRIHCSYWAYPTSFLTKSHFNELVERIGSLKKTKEYYGDLAGIHMFERWAQEYEIACELGAQSYVFHTIDYAAIDGAWEFTITREEILQAMVYMVQQFLIYLEERNLLSGDSPVIELENAGWGLEYGAQRWEDFDYIFNQLYDPYDKVRLGWDINHLLHALGFRKDKKNACFMLQDFEITHEMAELERKYGDNPKIFAMKWIEMNILNPAVIKKTNSLHLSDCELKEFEYFRNGRLQGIYGEKIDLIDGFDEKSDYGVKIVLDKYDSHIPMGKGVLLKDDLNTIIKKLKEKNKIFVLLHELKNSRMLCNDLDEQMRFLTF